MNKNSIIIYFCADFIMIAMFNLLQAESKKSTYSYGWTSPLKRKKHQQDMEKFGSENMSEGDQKKMHQVLRNMKTRNFKKIPLKKLRDNKLIEGVTTSTGIWINPHLPKSSATYIRHREAQEYWKKYEERGDWVRVCFNFSIAIDILSGCKLSLANWLMGEFFIHEIHNLNEKIKKEQRRVLRRFGYKDLAVNV